MLSRPTRPRVSQGGLLTYFFGKKGDGKLTLKKFEEFLNKLHDEIVLLEFNHYDYKVMIHWGRTLALETPGFPPGRQARRSKRQCSGGELCAKEGIRRRRH